MQTQKIDEIRTLAHRIDPRINLFEGYSPKLTQNYSGELLFWRKIVTIYGLLADSDRTQIRNKKNLFELMYRYELIERSDYEEACRFWRDISELRKWFCHNNDETLYYSKCRKQIIKNYLDRAFLFATNKPHSINDIMDWSNLVFDVDRRFQAYLICLESGLTKWKSSDNKEELIDQWIYILADSLFLNKELIHNVLAELAMFKKKDNNISNMTVAQLEHSYFRLLEESNFSEKNIISELRNTNISMRMNSEILLDSIKNSHIIS